eukprot:m.257863 g.257863  ORF g.257863 m.257863 type:complete len:120 (-) comp19185_c0_seq4:1913-2272(-)
MASADQETPCVGVPEQVMPEATAAAAAAGDGDAACAEAGLTGVDLGFAEPCDPRLLTPAMFPSKIGGRPVQFGRQMPDVVLTRSWQNRLVSATDLVQAQIHRRGHTYRADRHTDHTYNF